MQPFPKSYKSHVAWWFGQRSLKRRARKWERKKKLKNEEKIRSRRQWNPFVLVVNDFQAAYELWKGMSIKPRNWYHCWQNLLEELLLPQMQTCPDGLWKFHNKIMEKVKKQVQQTEQSTTQTILMPCKKNLIIGTMGNETRGTVKEQVHHERSRRILTGRSCTRQARCLPRKNNHPICSVNPKLERWWVRKKIFEILNSLCGHFFFGFFSHKCSLRSVRWKEQEIRDIEALLRTGTLSRRKLLNPLSRAIVNENRKSVNGNEA